MNKVFNFFLIILLIPIFLVISLFLIYFIMLTIAFLNFSLIETNVIAPNIYAIKGQMSNFYIIEDHGNYICIDAGDNIELTRKELKKLKINPELISKVFLTHTDFDHTKCLKLFNKAEVYISKLEQQMINGKTKRSPFTDNFKNLSGIKYKLVNDDESYAFGKINISVVYTPGHTPGSCSYIINGEYLFTGDALSLDKKTGKVKEFPSFFTMDIKTMRLSISKLKKFTNVKAIFTAHHGYSLNFKESIKDWK